MVYCNRVRLFVQSICSICIVTMASFMLFETQANFLKVFNVIFDVKIKLGDVQILLDPIREFLYTEDNMIQKPKDNLQHQTFVLAIYMYICRKLNKSMRLSHSILKFGEDLVFAGLYNLNYNTTDHHLDFLTIMEETDKCQPEYVEISEMEILFAIYGVDHKHNHVIQKYQEKDNMLSHYTPYELIVNLIEEIGQKETLVPDRNENIKSYISKTVLFTEKEKCKILMEQLEYSPYLNIKILQVNQNLNTIDYAYMNYCTICDRKVPIFATLDEYVDADKSNLYGVIMDHNLHNYIPETTILTNELFEAREIASEFEYGLVVAFPHDLLSNDAGLKVVKSSFMNRKYIPSHVKETSLGKRVTHLVYSSSTGSVYNMVTDYNSNKKLLDLSNITAIIIGDRKYTDKKFNIQ